MIIYSSLILFAWAPKKRRIYHNHSWKSTLNTTHCHNEKNEKWKQNNKKSRKNLEKLRNSTTYYTIQNVLFNFSLMFKQTFAIWWNWKKKWKKNCSKMTKLKERKRTKIWIYLLCDIRNAITVVGRGTLNRKVRLAKANAKTKRFFDVLILWVENCRLP